MRAIEIDDDVWEALKSKAEPLVDTENTVLRRVLGLGDTGSASQRLAGRMPSARTQSLPRARQGELTPQIDFYVPILQALDEAGGKLETSRVLDEVYRRMKHRLTPADLRPLRNIPWKNSVHWARKQMLDFTPPLLDGSSPRGWWKITPEGRDFLRKAA
jgi:hypothetical protein